MHKLTLAALGMGLALTACGPKEDAGMENQVADAEGEVLGGSINDDMLPLDTVTSTSPPMAATSGEDSSDSEPQGVQSGTESAQPEAEPAPQAENAGEEDTAGESATTSE